MGDEYRAPVGLPEWKQPSYDDDDRVDPDKYPEPKSGPVPNFLSRFFPDTTSQGLFVAKMFYFFFFAAFGSLFPLISVYFKQLGMDAAQTGFLAGIRPIVEYLATPFWHNIANRLRKGKILLLIATACWIIFTQPIGHIHPPVVSCKYWNGSSYLLKLPNTNLNDRDRRKRSTPDFPNVLTPDTVDELPLALPVMAMQMRETMEVEEPGWIDKMAPPRKRNSRQKRESLSVSPHWLPGHVVGRSPQIIDFAVNYEQNRHQEWVSPAYNNEVFERAGVHKVFFLILLLIIIGEFFSSPAIALADSAVITLLGEENQDKYSGQRMFGSIGWATAMFIIGMVLDHSKIFQDAKCDMNEGQRNYNVCFSVFSTLMGCALIVATQMPFIYTGPEPTNANAMPMNNIPNGRQPQKPKQMDQKEKLKEMASKTKVFAQQLQSMPEFIAVFKALTNLRLLMCMLVGWIMGVGIGLIFTFLFWHLQEFGGSPTLFGIASVINHMSEMAAYFYSFKIISKIGHVKVLAAGLLCNVLRFLYISLITWPWLVLPFEFVQGITHAAVWAAASSFIAHNTTPELRPSAQSFLKGIHHGFGRFCGAVFGGMLIKEYGSVMVFRVYGVVCAGFLVLFVLVNLYNRNEGSFSAELADEIDPTIDHKAAHLEPHGVPSSGLLTHMPRALSDVKLEETPLQAQEEGYGANLTIPGGANNPFLEDVAYDASGSRVEDQGQYYGRGYSQAQSGYSSSGFGY